MKIHELLSDPSKWTKYMYAKDKNGDGIGSRDKEAVCWCLTGAAMKCYLDGQSLDFHCYIEILNKIKIRIGGDHITTFNDNSTYEEVYNLVKELDV